MEPPHPSTLKVVEERGYRLGGENENMTNRVSICELCLLTTNNKNRSSEMTYQHGCDRRSSRGFYILFFTKRLGT